MESWVQWVVGLALPFVIGLMIYIWNRQQKQIDNQELIISTIKSDVSAISETQAKMQERCLQTHKADVHELDIRNILREELKTFKTDFSKEMLQCLKLNLIEEGYIVVDHNIATKRKRKNASTP